MRERVIRSIEVPLLCLRGLSLCVIDTFKYCLRRFSQIMHGSLGPEGPSIPKRVPVRPGSTLPKLERHPYFLPKLTEHDVSLTSSTVDLSGSRKVPWSFFGSTKLIMEDLCEVWRRYLLSFLSYRRTHGGGALQAHPQRARV